MATIFHLAFASDWAAAQEAGAYTVSTRGRTLADEGFIHCSRGDQWTGVRDRFYSDVAEALLLLQIDTDRLDVPVLDEAGEPGSAETFPHVYGPIPLDAVVKAMPVPAAGAAAAQPSSATTTPTTPTTAAQPKPAPGDSFGRTFLTEMFVNMALVVLILVTTSIGLGVGNAFGDEVAPLVGVVAGVVAGCAIARWLYVRRHG